VRTRIKELRARHDLTQADLAKLVGVRRETIHFVEKGEYNPSLLLAVRISKALGEGVEEIFLYTEEELEV
jgi:DNA-binding XRE family transcriptional regulator